MEIYLLNQVELRNPFFKHLGWQQDKTRLQAFNENVTAQRYSIRLLKYF